jgi:hypothetical protein
MNTPDGPDERAVVRTAAQAAEEVVFARYDHSEIDDLDLTVTFEDGRLEIDVYLDVDARQDPDRVADDAALAAQAAVDDLLE